MQRRRRKRTAIGILLLIVTLLIASFLTWFYGSQTGSQLREVLAEDCLSSQHTYLASLLVGAARRKAIVQQLLHSPTENSKPVVAMVAGGPIDKESQLIQEATLHRSGYTAYILKIADPSAVHLAETKYRDKGEALRSILQDTGALAGINAGAFQDPKGDGSGGTPIGTVFSFGRVVHSEAGRTLVSAILADNSFVVGSYNTADLQAMRAREAVHFYPELIVNGHPMITSGDGGWGYAPRTAMGATADGQILFIVTNGRFIDGPWNVGASLRDVQNILLSYGAVNALNLDGGGSTTMMLDGKLMNHPETDTAAGMRYLPNAFIVVPKPGLVNNGPGQLLPSAP